MKQRYAEKKQYEESLNQAEAIANGEIEDWQEVLKQWNEYYGNWKLKIFVETNTSHQW